MPCTACCRDVTYPSVSGTSVSRDFVELPSQLVRALADGARDTSANMPGTRKPENRCRRNLLDKVLAARTFDAGFDAIEYTSSALVDIRTHQASSDGEQVADPLGFEAAVLAELGMPAAITMRHRTPHFLHVFYGDGYAAGYYSYMWSEVLDADAFAAFEETGDPFDPETAARLRKAVYASGNSMPPEDAYKAFRQRLPTADAMIAKRGLSPVSAVQEGSAA